MRERYWLLALFISLITFQLSFAQSTVDGAVRSPQADKKSHTYKQGTEEEPFVVKTISSPKSKEDTDYETYEKHEKPTIERENADSMARSANATERLVYITIALAILNAALFIGTWRTASAAKKSADVLYATEKPYIHADVHLKSVNRESDVVTLETEFSVGNYGRTPAVHNLIEMLHNFEPKIPKGPYRDVFTRSWSTGIINKDKSLKDTTPIFLKNEDWEGIETHEPIKRLFLLIRVSYQDVFGKRDTKDFWWVYKPIDCVWSVYRDVTNT